MTSISEQVDLSWLRKASEARNLHGEWTRGGPAEDPSSYLTFYHGTRPETARTIARQGLSARSYTPHDPTLTPDKKEASLVAYEHNQDLEWPNKPASLVEVHIPKDRENEYLHPLSSHMGYRALKKPLPPEFIHAYSQTEGYTHEDRVAMGGSNFSNITEQVFELGFNPGEARGPGGEWINAPTAAQWAEIDARVKRKYEIPDHARLINPRSPYPDPADHPFFRAHPVSAENILKTYDATTPGEREQGARWYADTHRLAASVAGGDTRLGGGLMAAYSPQANWPVNLFNASRSAMEHRVLATNEGMVITRNTQKMVQGLLDGASIDDTIKGPKTNSFAHLIADGDDDPDDPYGKVVIDRHALSIAVGHRLPEDAAAPIDDQRMYQYVADEYRKAALARGLTPHQMQAITWLHQQTGNQGEDRAAGDTGELDTRLQRGRITSLEKAQEKWGAYTGEHQDIPVHVGTTMDRISEPITAAEARGNSRPVSDVEFQRLAGAGRAQLRDLRKNKSAITGLDRNWDSVKGQAWGEVQKSWGGATFDAHTGEALPQGADKYALTVRPPGMSSVSVPENASQADFADAMDRARAQFRDQLVNKQSYLGVFHDDENHRIDIDPATVVDTPAEAEQIGAYTHAVGGAYHFATGDGYFPPHVAPGAQLANESVTGVRWAGPGQWRSNAELVQPQLTPQQMAEIEHDEDDDSGDEDDAEPAREADSFSISSQLGIELAHVRTAAGAAYYHLPIGALITDHAKLAAKARAAVKGQDAEVHVGASAIVRMPGEKNAHLYQRLHDAEAARAGGERPRPGRMHNPPGDHPLGQFEFIGKHGENAGQAFLPGNAEPQVGDMARMMDAGGRNLVVGRVVAKDAGGHAVVDADDGRRHLVDWRNSGRVMHNVPLNQVSGVAPEAEFPGAINPTAEARAEAAIARLNEDWDKPGGQMRAAQRAARLEAQEAVPIAPPRNRLAANKVPAQLDVLGVPPGKEARARQLRAGGMGPESIRAYFEQGDEHPAPDSEAAARAEAGKLPVYTPRPVTPNGHDSAENQRLESLAAEADIAEAADRMGENLGGKTSVSRPGQGIQGNTRIVTLKDGTQVLRKTIEYDTEMADKEELASYVSRAIGAGSPAVARVPGRPDDLIEDVVPGGQTGMRWMYEQHYGVDENGNKAVTKYATPNDAEYALAMTPEGRKIAIFDHLISNNDRHDENWMVVNDKPVPIDNGSAHFDNTGATDRGMGPGLPDDLPPEELADMHSKLQALKPEFERLGQARWHRSMMQALASLGRSWDPDYMKAVRAAQVAKGSVPLVQDPADKFAAMGAE